MAARRSASWCASTSSIRSCRRCCTWISIASRWIGLWSLRYRSSCAVKRGCGKQQGGLLDFVSREIEIECLPGDIPEHIEIDVSELVLDQVVRVRDLLRPDLKWKPKNDLDTLLVHVIAPKTEEPTEEPVAEVAGTPAEPEVIKKGKVETPEGEET